MTTRGQAVEPRALTLTCVDGTTLRGVFHESAKSERRAADADNRANVVLAPAAATSQDMYQRLAAFLASEGVSTLTFDYRGVGASRAGKPLNTDITVADWGQQDLPAALNFMSERAPEAPLVLLGHSIGGQLLGYLPHTEQLSGIVLVATQSGYYGHWSGWRRWQVWLHWKVLFPSVTGVLGYFPGRILGGQDLPPKVVADGVRWGTHQGYYIDDPGIAERLASIRCPVLAYSFSDDHLHGCKRSVEQFLDWLTNEDIEIDHRHIEPAMLSLPTLGHSGFFARRARSLWYELVEFLDRLPSPAQVTSFAGADAVLGTSDSSRSIFAPSWLRALAIRTNIVHDRTLDGYTTIMFRLLKMAIDRRVAIKTDQIPAPQDGDGGGDQGNSVEVERVSAFRPEGMDIPVLDENFPARPRWATAAVLNCNRRFPVVDQSGTWTAERECESTLKRIFGDLLPDQHEAWDDPTSDAALSQFAFQGLCAHRVQRRPDGGFLVSFGFMEDYEVRDGLARYGGDLRLDERGDVESITYLGQVFRPDDASWEHIKLVFRSTAFVAVTLIDHLGVTHYGVSNAVALAARRHLPAEHPLRRLLAPFTYGTVAINYAAHTSLVLEGGLLHRAAGLRYDSLLAAIETSFSTIAVESFAARQRRLGVHPESLTAGLRRRFAYTVDGLDFAACIARFVDDAFSERGSLAYVWHAPLFDATAAFWYEVHEALGIAPEELSSAALRRFLDYVLFTVTVFHKQVGYVAPYLNHPGFVAGRVRPESRLSDVQASVQVATVAVLTGIEVPMMSGDFSHLMPDPDTRAAATALTERLVMLEQRIAERNRERRFPSSVLLPSNTPCSVSR